MPFGHQDFREAMPRLDRSGVQTSSHLGDSVGMVQSLPGRQATHSFGELQRILRGRWEGSRLRDIMTPAAEYYLENGLIFADQGEVSL